MIRCSRSPYSSLRRHLRFPLSQSPLQLQVGRSFYFADEAGSTGNPSSTEDTAFGTSNLLTPSTVGFGDSAPRYPRVLALPVTSRPVFPMIPRMITLRDEETIEAVEKLGQANGYVAVFLRKKYSTGVTEGGVIIEKPEVITEKTDLYRVGTFCQLHRLSRHPIDPKDPLRVSTNEGTTPSENLLSLWLTGQRRVDLMSIDNVGPPIDVTVSHWDRLETTGNTDTIRALSNEILSTIREVAQMNELFRESITWFPARVDANDPFRLADFCASISKAATPEDLQAILEEKDPEMRLHKALVLLNKEREVAKLQKEISAKVDEKLSELQRKHFLHESLKVIKKELGLEQDDKAALLDNYRKQLAQWPLIPAEIQEVIDREMEKLSTLEKNSSEFNITRTYLDWLCNIPWGKMTTENYDLKVARQILDSDHYGLDHVKDIILQFIAVGKLKGSVQGKILCLAGPPGVGKTSIAKGVARALGRDFYRFSVGGLSDVSEIKGHRRTYVGAMPGKLIQCLKGAGSMNPLVLIDEIDKLGSDYRGDPASALLEVLDPSQNSSFLDHYLDVPVDISKVLFMCTANDLERISGPLLDRMEIIRLSSYDFHEKVAIAERYLVPKSMAESGLMVKKEPADDDPDKAATTDEDVSPLALYKHADNVPDSLSIDKCAIESLVRWYAREAGVRSLAKYVDKITRKLALQVVAEGAGTELNEKSARKSDSWNVTESNLADYVGKQIFTSDRMYIKDPMPNGVVMGLAFTSMGGSALYIETQVIRRGLDEDQKRRGGGNLKVTGQLGDVMQESATIAYTVARARLALLDPSNNFFDENDIHLHVPEGATPKDGPSAGVTMVTSMLSLALDTPVRADVAMTGEISLTGAFCF